MSGLQGFPEILTRAVQTDHCDQTGIADASYGTEKIAARRDICILVAQAYGLHYASSTFCSRLDARPMPTSGLHQVGGLSRTAILVDRRVQNTEMKGDPEYNG